MQAEVGEVIVTCIRTNKVERYHIGRGSSWVTDLADDLRVGKFDANLARNGRRTTAG